MDQAIRSTRPGGMVGYVGVPNGGPELPVRPLFSSNVGVNGGVAPVRNYVEELLQDVWSGAIDPGRVFDLELPLDARSPRPTRRWMSGAPSRRSCVRRRTGRPGPAPARSATGPPPTAAASVRRDSSRESAAALTTSRRLSSAARLRGAELALAQRTSGSASGSPSTPSAVTETGRKRSSRSNACAQAVRLEAAHLVRVQPVVVRLDR